MQTAIKLLPGILRSRHLSRRVKTEAFFHLTNTIVYPLMVLLTLLMFPAFLNFYSPLHEHWRLGQWLFSLSLFILATCSASTFFVFAQSELFGREAGWKTIKYLPVLMALGVGISLNNAKAVIEAVWSALRRKPSEFVRTPKYGMVGQDRAWKRTGVYTKLAMPIVEIAFGCFMTVWIIFCIDIQFWMTSIPFLMIFAGGYFYVGFGTLHVLFKMQRQAREAIVAAAAPADPVST